MYFTVEISDLQNTSGQNIQIAVLTAGLLKLESGPCIILSNTKLIVPILSRREELYTQVHFFCSDNFDRSIYLSFRVVIGITRKPVQRRKWNSKEFCYFRF